MEEPSLIMASVESDKSVTLVRRLKNSEHPISNKKEMDVGC
jgi:hypothetical protein